MAAVIGLEAPHCLIYPPSSPQFGEPTRIFGTQPNIYLSKLKWKRHCKNEFKPTGNFCNIIYYRIDLLELSRVPVGFQRARSLSSEPFSVFMSRELPSISSRRCCTSCRLSIHHERISKATDLAAVDIYACVAWRLNLPYFRADESNA